ncbi:UNVERIFIED_CONTAM: hypothetical protein Sradi_2267700 [Sesamum radiatum]|uniref:Aminotransferase-like plant mobile domain-containing protein n=1 Tax=Sesamum radiatum TaxID=300843 RepID=A0AAW2T479_SESRA
MAEQRLNSSTIEEREEYMISPTGGSPTLRKAYFLRPTATSVEGPSLKLPSLTPKPQWPLKVAFSGWRYPLRKWRSWVQTMHSRYSSVWKDAGIYDAVMGSIYKIQRDEDLVFGIAERWCSETNTFFFPWGESTITLEDMLILGGFSVVGGPVSLPLETNELLEIENILEENRRNLARPGTDRHAQWLNLFMESGSVFEHEAFISLWLSRFVFPGNHLDGISSHVFSIAIHLARGRRLALGPAVLACIYRDLGLLREAMAASTKLMSEDDSILSLTLSSPFGLVQVWAWERLPPMQPEPNFISSGGVRVARWGSPKRSEIGNVRPAINSAGVTFLWRPYALAVDNWSFPSFYKEEEELIKGGGLSVELESFVRCLRPSLLVGIDCQEPYLPHRVAMQFGFDQDLPRWIPRGNMSLEIAWSYYSESLSDDEMLYLPPRLSESDVTIRYLEWWRRAVLCPVDAIKGLVKQRRSPRKPLIYLQDSEQMILASNPDGPPHFPLKCPGKQKKKHHLLPSYAPNSLSITVGKPSPGTQPVIKLEEDVAHNSEVPEGGQKSTANEYLQKLILSKTANDPEVPPGFPPRCVEAATISHSSVVIWQPCCKKHNKERISSCHGVSCAAHEENLLSPVAVGYLTSTQLERNLNKDVAQNEVGDINSETVAFVKVSTQLKGRKTSDVRPVMAAEYLHGSNSEEPKNSSSHFNLAAVSDLEARIIKLENELAALRNSE